jgi:hypothetical protein
MSEITSEISTALASSSEVKSNKPQPNKQPHKRKPPFKGKQDNKRPRYTGPEHPVAFNQQQLSKTLSTTPVIAPHRIQTSTIGLYSLATLVHKVLISRDSKLNNSFSLDSLVYCSTLATIYRLYQVGEDIGYHFDTPHSYSTLKQLALAIVLPEPICRYIESIGKVDTLTGVSVVPYIPTMKELLTSSDHLDLAEYAARVTKDISVLRQYVKDGEPEYPDDLDWDDIFSISLHSSAVIDYISGTQRGYKANVLFRKCDFSVTTGKPEFLVSYKSMGIHRTGFAPYEMEDNLVQIGATFGFRNEDKRSQWQGDNACIPALHQARNFIYEVYVVSNIMSQLTAPTR